MQATGRIAAAIAPKWIGGQVNREYFRKSAATRQWNEAEDYRLKLEDALVKGLPPFGPEPESSEPESLLASLSVSATAGGPPLLVEQRRVKIIAVKPGKERVTVEVAVEAYLADARSREFEFPHRHGRAWPISTTLK